MVSSPIAPYRRWWLFLLFWATTAPDAPAQASWTSSWSRRPRPESVPEFCQEHNLRFDERLHKCVIGIGEHCGFFWRLKPSAIACGDGDGLGVVGGVLNEVGVSIANGAPSGYCDGTSGYCRCNKGFTLSADGDRCLAPGGHGLACLHDRRALNTFLRRPTAPGPSPSPCQDQFECVEGRCVCQAGGVWNPEQELCYSDLACQQRARVQGDMRGRVFYDHVAGLCKCALGGVGCSLDGLGLGFGILQSANGSASVNASANVSKACPTDSVASVTSESTNTGNTYEELQSVTVLCTCQEGLVPSEDFRACLEVKEFGEGCETARGDPCDKRDGLACIEGTCQCSVDRVRDVLEARCKLRVGQHCRALIQFAAEPTETSSTPAALAECTRFSACVFAGVDIGVVCTCDSSMGYVETAEGTCAARHDHGTARCLLNSDCEQGRGLVCMNGRCRCRGLRSQFYSEEAGECVGRVGAACGDMDVARGACAPGSYCDRNSTRNRSKGICTCGPGLAKAPNREGCLQMVSEYGASCLSAAVSASRIGAAADLDLDSALPGHLQCDKSKGLACINGSCECSEPLAVYRSIGVGSLSSSKKSKRIGGGGGGKCFALPGAPCGRLEMDGSCMSGRGLESCEFYDMECVDGSSCERERVHVHGGNGNGVGGPMSRCTGEETHKVYAETEAEVEKPPTTFTELQPPPVLPEAPAPDEQEPHQQSEEYVYIYAGPPPEPGPEEEDSSQSEDLEQPSPPSFNETTTTPISISVPQFEFPEEQEQFRTTITIDTNVSESANVNDSSVTSTPIPELQSEGHDWLGSGGLEQSSVAAPDGEEDEDGGQTTTTTSTPGTPSTSTTTTYSTYTEPQPGADLPRREHGHGAKTKMPKVTTTTEAAAPASQEEEEEYMYYELPPLIQAPPPPEAGWVNGWEDEVQETSSLAVPSPAAGPERKTEEIRTMSRSREKVHLRTTPLPVPPTTSPPPPSAETTTMRPRTRSTPPPTMTRAGTTTRTSTAPEDKGRDYPKTDKTPLADELAIWLRMLGEER